MRMIIVSMLKFRWSIIDISTRADSTQYRTTLTEYRREMVRLEPIVFRTVRDPSAYLPSQVFCIGIQSFK